MPVRPYAERTFAAVDLVVARRNDYPHGLINDDRGIVTAVDVAREEVTVRFGQRHVHVPAEYLRDGGLDHGYALTVHQAQGLTCRHALLLGSDALYTTRLGTSRSRAAGSATTCTSWTATVATSPPERTVTRRGVPTRTMRSRRSGPPSPAAAPNPSHATRFDSLRATAPRTARQETA